MAIGKESCDIAKTGDGLMSAKGKLKRRVRQSKCECQYCKQGETAPKGLNGKPQHICHFTECKKTFDYARSLYRHLRLHDGQKNHACPKCSKEFSRKDTLKAHIATHITDGQLKGRWVKCECANCIKGGKKTECLEKKWQHVCHFRHCKKAYTQLGNLKRHLRSHSDKRNFVCAHCDMRFSRKENLRWHMNIHINEGRKWSRCSCPYCTIDGGCKVRAPVTGQVHHACHFDDCDKEFGNTWLLRRHLETHSAKKNYFCPICKKGIARKDSFDRHVKNHSKVNCKNSSAFN